MHAIVITAYNRKEFIEDAILSLLNQKDVNLKEFELIFSVNFDIKDILEKYDLNDELNLLKKEFKEIKISEASLKIGETYANALKQTNALSFFILDDDDLFTENHIKRVLDYASGIKLKSFCIHNKQYFINEKNEFIKPIRNYTQIKWHNASSFYIHFADEKEKNEFIEFIKNIDIASDLAIYTYFLDKNTYFEIPDKLTYYRIHNNNVSIQINKIRLERYQRDHEYLSKYAQSKQTEKILRKIIYHNAILLNTMYNENLPVSIRDIDFRFNSFVKYILYKLNRKLLKKILLKRYHFEDIQ